MSEPVADHVARRTLTQHRIFATSLLVVMAVLMLASFALPDRWWTGFLQASAKAGLIGGIADWFAVTALFRHPLGIPIPHTAIIPNNKERLGRALGRFVATHVFTPAEVSSFLSRFDMPGMLCGFLTHPATARPAAVAIAGMLPKILASVEDGRARRLLARIVPRLLGGPGAGRLVARALHKLVEGGRHQEVFGFTLQELRRLLDSKEETLRLAIEERVREQGGRLVGWALGASIAKRVISTATTELDRMSPNGSELRLAFDEWVRREIARMEEDPARASEIGMALRGILTHDTVQAWLWDVWSRLRTALEADAAKPSGRTVDVIQAAMANAGEILRNDPGARARVQSGIETTIVMFFPAGQAQLAGFIAQVFTNWDTRTITEKLELHVGKDLQYIRVNGTLVGFLLGGALYAIIREVLGQPGF